MLFRKQNSSLSDGFTFEQVGILGIPHNLARQVLECARRRASQASVNDFRSLTHWVSTGQKVVNSYKYLLVLRHIGLYNARRAPDLVFSFI